MKSLQLLSAVLAVTPVTAMPRKQARQQAVLDSAGQKVISQYKEGVGHFSEWSRQTKKEFLIDWQAGKESEWVIVEGNEGGVIITLKCIADKY